MHVGKKSNVTLRRTAGKVPKVSSLPCNQSQLAGHLLQIPMSPTYLEPVDKTEKEDSRHDFSYLRDDEY